MLVEPENIACRQTTPYAQALLPEVSCSSLEQSETSIGGLKDNQTSSARPRWSVLCASLPTIAPVVVRGHQSVQ